MAPIISVDYLCKNPILFLMTQDYLRTLNFESNSKVEIKNILLKDKGFLQVFISYINKTPNFSKGNKTEDQTRKSAKNLRDSFINYLDNEYPEFVSTFIRTPVQKVCHHAALIAYLKFNTKYFENKDVVEATFDRGQNTGKMILDLMDFGEADKQKLSKRKNALRGLIKSTQGRVVYDHVYKESTVFDNYDYPNMNLNIQTDLKNYCDAYKGHTIYEIIEGKDDNPSQEICDEDDKRTLDDISKEPLDVQEKIFKRYLRRVASLQVEVENLEQNARNKGVYISKLQKKCRNESSKNLNKYKKYHFNEQEYHNNEKEDERSANNKFSISINKKNRKKRRSPSQSPVPPPKKMHRRKKCYRK